MHAQQHAARRKFQEERVKKAAIGRGWTEYVASDTLPPAGSFKREHRIGFDCLSDVSSKFCRIDFIFHLRAGGYVFLEVDENQHLFGYDAELSCDMKRMSNVATSLTMEHPDFTYMWVRYNPNAWHVDGVTTRVPKEQREQRLFDYLDRATLSESVGLQAVQYWYYDQDDGQLEVLDNDEFHPEFAKLAVNATTE
jgi:hypothetical protein